MRSKLLNLTLGDNESLCFEELNQTFYLNLFLIIFFINKFLEKLRIAENLIKIGKSGPQRSSNFVIFEVLLVRLLSWQIQQLMHQVVRLEAFFSHIEDVFSPLTGV